MKGEGGEQEMDWMNFVTICDGGCPLRGEYLSAGSSRDSPSLHPLLTASRQLPAQIGPIRSANSALELCSCLLIFLLGIKSF